MIYIILLLIFTSFVSGAVYGRFARNVEIRDKVSRKVWDNRSNPNAHVRNEPAYIKGFEDGMIWTVEEMYGYPLQWVDKRGDIRGR
jgi:hypothetical protein